MEILIALAFFGALVSISLAKRKGESYNEDIVRKTKERVRQGKMQWKV